MKKAKPKRGPPSSYTKATADSICSQLAEGVNLREICRGSGMPAWRTVYAWSEEHPDFAAAIARARVSGYDAIAHEALEIADTPLEGVETTIDDKGVSEKRGDMLGHRKMQIETRLKLLAKWDPKRYGERLELEHKGQVDLVSTLNEARGRAKE